MYQIFRNKEYRMVPRSVIITHVRNLYANGTWIEPSAKRGSFHYTWGIWQKYFHDELRKGTVMDPSHPALPCHYFVELLDEDYVIYSGCNILQPSCFLQELADAKVIPYGHRNDILIAIGEDYSFETPEDRMLEHLCEKILASVGLQYRWQDPVNKVLLFDEVLVPDWKEQMFASKLKYDITPMKLFNKDRLTIQYRKFKK